jgi:hypothetical protein
MGALGRSMPGLSAAICGEFHVGIVPLKIPMRVAASRWRLVIGWPVTDCKLYMRQVAPATSGMYS